MRFLFLLLLLQACSGSNPRGLLRIGIDPHWYPLDFGTQTSYVNGYAEDLLLEMARYTGMEFERIPANWDTLLEGLEKNRYDAVLTSMPPYEYQTAKYEFSSNFLDLGPVLIFPLHAPETNLSKLDGAFVGIVANDPAALLLEKPPVIIRSYPSIPALLDALVKGDIQAALLDQIPAANYVSDLYADKLQIVGGPLNDKGLHLIAPKDKKKAATAFSKGLDSLRKRKTLDALREKWGLASKG